MELLRIHLTCPVRLPRPHFPPPLSPYLPIYLGYGGGDEGRWESGSGSEGRLKNKEYFSK